MSSSGADTDHSNGRPADWGWKHQGPPLTTFFNNEAVCWVCVVVQSGKKRLVGSFSVQSENPCSPNVSVSTVGGVSGSEQDLVVLPS